MIARIIAGIGGSLFVLGLLIFTTETIIGCAASCTFIFGGLGILKWISTRWYFGEED